MTLLEMASLVCGKVRQSDAAGLTRCKEYLRHRYRMIAAEELWKDLLFAIPFTYDMTAETAGELFGPNWFSRDAGIWHLPSSVDKVLALRSAAGGVAVSDQYQFFRMSPDQFAETGEPVEFFQEQRVVADLRGKLAEVEADGVVLTNGAPDNTAYKIRYLDLDGEQQDFVGNFVAAGGSSASFYPQIILSATRLTGQASAYFSLGGTEIAIAGANRTDWKTYPTLRLMPRPTADVSLRALVKRKCIELTEDGDSPEINGVENCLMAFAQADMLQRARAYAKADAVVGEASALLKQLKTVAVAQEANLNRIVPFVGEVPGEMTNFGGKGYW